MQVAGSKAGHSAATLAATISQACSSCQWQEEKGMNSDDDVDEAGPSPSSTEASGDYPQASDSAVKGKEQQGSFHEGADTFQCCTIERS